MEKEPGNETITVDEMAFGKAKSDIHNCNDSENVIQPTNYFFSRNLVCKENLTCISFGVL